MKKLVSFLITSMILCAAMVGGALAATPAETATLTETVQRITAITYPTAVTEYGEGDARRISKVYELSATDDPTAIPTAAFEREGYTYTLLDLTKQDQTASDSKLHSETVTVPSKSKETDKVLALLAPTQDVTTEDGYTGVLTLDTATIKVEAAGYGSSSRTVTATRSYPNLSDADTAFVPKTTEDNGRTLELADVQWQEAGGFYHATATYTGTATSKYATGYTVTASYTGEVSKTTSDKVIYTATFGGTPIVPAEPAPAAFAWSRIAWLALPIGAGVVVLAVVLIRHFKNKSKHKEGFPA